LAVNAGRLPVLDERDAVEGDVIDSTRLVRREGLEIEEK